MIADDISSSDLYKILNYCGVIINFYTRNKNEIQPTINYLMKLPIAGEWVIFTMPNCLIQGNMTTVCMANATQKKLKRILNLKAFL